MAKSAEDGKGLGLWLAASFILSLGIGVGAGASAGGGKSAGGEAVAAHPAGTGTGTNHVSVDAAIDAKGELRKGGAPDPGTHPGRAGSGISAHPKDLRYPDLAYSPPGRDDHRAVLTNGLRVYLVPDRTLPTIHIEAWIEASEAVVPKEKRGLARLTGGLMRTGGIAGVSARDLDRRLDALAASIDVDFAADRGHATLWTLAKHQAEALRLFAGVLMTPVFEEDRVRRARDELAQAVDHQDDEPDAQVDRKVLEVVFGDHPLAWSATSKGVAALGQADCAAFHAAHVGPMRTVLAVSGDFEANAMRKQLEALLGGWRPTATGPMRPPAFEGKPRPGVFIVDRPVNQGFVEMAQAGIALGHKDEVPLQVMNFILGGGSFTSRITARVRNDEGLAYSAGSYNRPGRGNPGLIGVYFQSKAASTAFAAKICAEEVKRIRTEPVGADELDRARKSLRDRFPERFSTAQAAAGALAQAEFEGRPADWFETYRAKIDAVTADDVKRVATEHLAPERMSVVIVGPRSVIEARDEEHKAGLADLGTIEALKGE